MKRLLLVIFVFVCGLGAYADEQKIFDMTWQPYSFFKFLEDNIEDYWRFPDHDREKIMQGEYGVMLRSFEKTVEQFHVLLRSSGAFGIDRIDSKSYHITGDGKSSFRTDTEIGFATDSKGFLQGLLKKLPEHKIPKIPENDDFNDLYILTDDTLMAFDIPLNFNEAFKAIPENSALRNELGKFTQEYLGMDINEFIDQITGEWGGVIYVNRSKKDRDDISLDFILILPDPGRKLYKRFGEELVMRRRAEDKKEFLNVRIMPNHPDMMLIPLDDLMMVCSSPNMLVKFTQAAEKKLIHDRVKKLNVPPDLKYDAFFYWNKEFSAVASSLFFSYDNSLRFMTDFSGSDAFSSIKIDEKSLKIQCFSDASIVQMLLMPYTVAAMMHADNMIYKQGKSALVSDKTDIVMRDCISDMKRYAGFLKMYAEKHGGSYPAGLNEAGLRELAAFADISKDEFSRKDGDRVVPFGKFYYWGANCKSKSSNLPLLTDRGSVHKNKIHVLFCDGSVREFELKNVRSARKIASFLHTVFAYDAQTFDMLMKQAEALDSEKL